MGRTQLLALTAPHHPPGNRARDARCRPVPGLLAGFTTRSLPSFPAACADAEPVGIVARSVQAQMATGRFARTVSRRVVRTQPNRRHMLLRMHAHFLMKWAQYRMHTASITFATTMVGSMAALLYVRCGICTHLCIYCSLPINFKLDSVCILAGCI